MAKNSKIGAARPERYGGADDGNLLVKIPGLVNCQFCCRCCGYLSPAVGECHYRCYNRESGSFSANSAAIRPTSKRKAVNAHMSAISSVSRPTYMVARSDMGAQKRRTKLVERLAAKLAPIKKTKTFTTARQIVTTASRVSMILQSKDGTVG